jgi:alcohol dehydrogenase
MGTGGVSIFAVQLAKRLGAGVIATTSSDEKRDFLLRLGADQTLNYTEDADWGASVKRLTGGAGVDRVVEVGGVGTFTNSLEAVARGGEVVLIGYLTGNDNRIEFARLRGSGAIMRPIAVGDRANLESLVRAISASKLVPVIDRTFPFEHATQAFERLRDRLHVGKIVIKVGGELA